MALTQVFSINVIKLLTLNGWTCQDLADKCEGKLKRSYVTSLKNGDKINPSLEVVDIVAKIFNIPAQQLLNPNLPYDRSTVLPAGFFRKEYLVDEFQDITISNWEEKNKEIIKSLCKSKQNNPN